MTAAAVPRAGGTGPVARLLLSLVHGYRWLTAGRASPCRYYPSCSTYALEALEVHGAARGGWLTLRRLGRCQPWGGHGIDLVPLPRASRRAVHSRPTSMSDDDRKVR